MSDERQSAVRRFLVYHHVALSRLSAFISVPRSTMHVWLNQPSRLSHERSEAVWAKLQVVLGAEDDSPFFQRLINAHKGKVQHKEKVPRADCRQRVRQFCEKNGLRTLAVGSSTGVPVTTMYRFMNKEFDSITTDAVFDSTWKKLLSVLDGV
jgi:hypothetical protein